jgi:hypothetical protein
MKLSADNPLVYNRVYRTCPSLVHAPGKIDESPWWETIKEELFKSPRSDERCESLAVVTWNSGSPNSVLDRRGHTLGWFERSLAHWGLGCTVLGGGIGAAWYNRLKIDLTIDFLHKCDRELVLGADSSDVLLVGQPRRLIDAFHRQPAEVLFNAEKNSWPPRTKTLGAFERRVGRGPFRYLNSGVWLGRREACLRAFKAARQWAERLDGWPTSDQICWKYAYRELYPLVQIDWRCELFQSLNQVRHEIDVRGNKPPLISCLYRFTRGWL